MSIMVEPLADQWLNHCQQTPDTGNTFTAQRVEIAKQSRQSLKIGASARYAVFRQYLPVGGTLLTAHHQDDQLETLLLA